MLITFKSKAAADVLMYEEHAKRILDLLHKDLKRGVITAAEAGNAVSLLEAEIADSKRNPPPDETASDRVRRGADASADDENDPEAEKLQIVTFATRAYPLLEMLRAAEHGQHDVMWGV